jgi:hypothetical protein
MRPWSGRRSKTNSLGGVEGESSTVEPHRPTFTEGPVTSHDAALFTGVPRRREILLTSPRIHRQFIALWFIGNQMPETRNGRPGAKVLEISHS